MEDADKESAEALVRFAAVFADLALRLASVVVCADIHITTITLAIFVGVNVAKSRTRFGV